VQAQKNQTSTKAITGLSFSKLIQAIQLFLKQVQNVCKHKAICHQDLTAKLEKNQHDYNPDVKS